jgi:hypothetical protein
MRLTVLSAFVMIALLGSARAGAPKFTKKPTAKKQGAGAIIEFAVNRETDVAVFIENGAGKVVRHLVAGRLGKNAPKPLKPGLSQSVTWDGKADWGKPAGSGPFKVRVALRLGAKFGGVVVEEKQNFGYTIKGMVVGKNGELYVLTAIGAHVPNWGSEQLIALNREGEYLRTIMPFPANMEREKLGKLPTVMLDGKLSPLVHKIASRNFYPGFGGGGGLGMTPDGVIVMASGGYWGAYGIFVNAVKNDGSIPWGNFQGPELTKKRNPSLARASVCISSDGKWAYVSGYEKTPAVHRVSLPKRDRIELFFGDLKTADKDSSHLGGRPKGLALDGRGNLLVADPKNNRVILVSEKTRKLTGEFKFESPDCVAVDPGTGNVYLTRARKKGFVDLVKIKGVKDPTPVATMIFKPERDRRYHWLMTLDARAKPPIIWMGGNGGTLQRITESGGKFSSKRVDTKKYLHAGFVDLQVDRWRPNAEVYTRCRRGLWMRYEESGGKISMLGMKGNGGSGLCIMPAPDGNFYGVEWPAGLFKWDRNGKPLTWKNPEPGAKNFNRKYRARPHGTFMPVCMGFMAHTYGVRGDGHHFAFSRLPTGPYRGTKALHEYDQTGKRIRGPIIWKASDNVLGPRFDQQGNIYVADQVKPAGQFCPQEFKSILGEVKLGAKYPRSQGKPRGAILSMYGSIMKFSPRGGMIDHHPGAKPKKGKKSNVPFVGKPKLDPKLKTADANWHYGDLFQCSRPAKVTGALWMKLGISHIPLFYCNCETTRFDVDEFGRVWYPDLGRFRVCVLDTNGNEITEFGQYGNADAPTKPGQKEIPLAWLIGVGVSEKYAYMGDTINKRLQRAELTYAAEETTPIR